MAKGGNTPRIEVALTMGAAWEASVSNIRNAFNKTFKDPLKITVDIDSTPFDVKLRDIESDFVALSRTKLITVDVDDSKAVESVQNLGKQLSKYFSDNIKPINLDEMLDADGAISSLKSVSESLKDLTKEYSRLVSIGNQINKAGKEMALEELTDKQTKSATAGIEAFINRLNKLSSAYAKFYDDANGKKIAPKDYGNELVSQLKDISQLGKIEVGFIGTLSPDSKASIKESLSELSAALNAEGTRIKVQAELVDYRQIQEQTEAKPIPIRVYPKIDLDGVFESNLQTQVNKLNKKIKEDPGFQIKLGIDNTSFTELKSFKALLGDVSKNKDQKPLVDINISDSTKTAIKDINTLSKAVKTLSENAEKGIDFTKLRTSFDGFKSDFSGAEASATGLYEVLQNIANISDKFKIISENIKKITSAANGLNKSNKFELSDGVKDYADKIIKLSTALKTLKDVGKNGIKFEGLQKSLESIKDGDAFKTLFDTLNNLPTTGVANVANEFDRIAKSVEQIAAHAANFKTVMSSASTLQKPAADGNGGKKAGKPAAGVTKGTTKTAQGGTSGTKQTTSYKSVISDFNKLKTAADAFDTAISAINGEMANPFIDAKDNVKNFNNQLDTTRKTISDIEALIAKGDLKSASQKLSGINLKGFVDDSKTAIKDIKRAQSEEEKIRQQYLKQDSTVNTKPFDEQIAKIVKLRAEFESLKKTVSDSRLMEMGFITTQKDKDGNKKPVADRAKYEAELNEYITKLNQAKADVRVTRDSFEANVEAAKTAEQQAAAYKDAAESMQKIELAGEGIAKKLKAMRSEGEQTAKIAQKAEKAVVNIQKALENPRIKGTTYEKQLKQLLERANKNTGSETANINAELARINMQIQKAGLAVDTFGNKLIRTFSARLRAAISGSGMILVSQGFREIYQNVKDVDAAMTELKKVTDATNSEFIAFLDGASERAQKLGGSLADVVSATADYSRLGYSLEQATDLADVAIMSKNVWDEVDNIDDVTSSLISTMKGFGIEAENAIEISDKFNEV